MWLAREISHYGDAVSPSGYDGVIDAKSMRAPSGRKVQDACKSRCREQRMLRRFFNVTAVIA